MLVFLKFKAQLVPHSLLAQLNPLTSPGPNETVREKISSSHPPSKPVQGKSSVTGASLHE